MKRKRHSPEQIIRKLRQADAELADQARILQTIADSVAAEYPKARINIEIKKQYRNMIEALEKEPRAVKLAEGAFRRIGVTPKFASIRGGTDGSRVAAGSTEGQVGVWIARADRLENNLAWADLGVVADLAFSPDGTRLAAAAIDPDDARRGAVRVWDLRDGNELGHHPGQNCRAVRWSPDGANVLLEHDTLRRWDVTSQPALALGQGMPWGVRSMDFTRSADGWFVAVAAGDGRIRFYDARLSDWCPVSGFHESAVADHVDVCFAPDGQRAASAGPDGLRVWDLYPARVGRLPALHESHWRLTPSALSSDGTLVVGQCEWDPTIEPQDPSAPDTDVASVATQSVEPMRRPFVCRREGNTWRVLAGQARAGCMCPSTTVLGSGRFVFGWYDLTAESTTLVITDPAAPDLDQTGLRVRGYANAFYWLERPPSILLVGLRDGRLLTCALDPTGLGELHEIPIPGEPSTLGPLTWLTATRDSTFVGACWEGRAAPGRVIVWQARGSGRFDKAYEIYADFPAPEYTWRMAFARDHNGDLLAATAGSARDVCLWELPSGRLRAKLTGHRDAIRQCLALDDRLLVTSSDDRTVRVWDAVERGEVCQLYAGSQSRPLIEVAAGSVAVVDGGTLTVANTSEVEHLISGDPSANSPARFGGSEP